MSPIAVIQHWNSIIPDYEATAWVFLVATAVTTVSGLLRRRNALNQWLPAVLFVTAAAVAMWPGLRMGWMVAGAGLVCAASALSVHLWCSRADEAAEEGTTRGGGIALLIAVGTAAFLLFNGLGSYSGNVLLGWEATVIRGFGDAFMRGESVARFALQRFLWDDGILSAGNTSLFYGAPTYWLFHVVGFSPWTMRCAAVVATLLSIAVAYVVARRFFGTVVAGAVALLLALNPAALFYGRYGSSPAGTMLAVLLAVWATWLFLERERSAWWRAVLCAVALYLATVQYSPARLVVLILLGFIPIALAYQWRQLGWQRPLGVLVVALAAVGVWQLESSFHRQVYFLHARGEQFFDLIKGQDYINNTLYAGHPVPPHLHAGALTFPDKVQLLGRALMITVPQYLKLMLPSLTPPARGVLITLDPPPLPLYYGPAALFIVWGLLQSLRRWRSWPHVCLLLWVAAGTVPLLLTNRVDAHRIMLFVIPLSFWGAFGVREAARVMATALVPVFLQRLLALALVVTGTYSVVNLLYYPHPPDAIPSRALAAELATVPGRVAVVADGWQREVGWADLALLERTRESAQRRSWLVDEGMVYRLRMTQGPALEGAVRQLRRETAGATLLFLPAEKFRAAGAVLAGMGLRVTERGLPQFHVLRVDEGEQATGVAAEQIEALPTPVIRPSPTPPKPIVLPTGPKQWLTESKPLDVQFSFRPPQVDRTWDNSPLRMGGIEYAHGIGMHAVSRVTYPVPANATAFQAIIGLSDGVRDCPRTGVTFEVRDDKDHLLYQSGFVDNSVPPQAIEVPLHDTNKITLVVTDGGNGLDCDHADWAMAAFLLAK